MGVQQLVFIILKRNSKQMSREFDFQNLDLYSCQDFDNLRTPTSQPLKTLVGTADEPAGLPPQEQQEESFYQKSALIPTEGFQISFEKDFMREHEAVFQTELKNFLECFRSYSQKVRGLPATHQTLLKPDSQTLNCLEFIKTRDFGITLAQTQKFVDKFNTFDKLSQFLNLVVSSCPERISIELILVAKKVLERYQKIQIQLPSQADLLHLAQDVARCYRQPELLNLKGVAISKCKEAAVLVQAGRKFMEAYCATVILVIAQYFENPYGCEQMDCFKRQLSPCCSEDDESEEGLSCGPAKKRKFQF